MPPHELRFQLRFQLNGEEITLADPRPELLLSDYLHEVGLTGTKVACGQGGCGACTVMLSARDPETGRDVHRAINSCLRPLCACDGLSITTTEGLGAVKTGLDRVQFAIAAGNGSQCGFCTPGFVMNAHALLRANPEATEQQLEDQFGGNICRCTGYRPILQAVRSLASDHTPQEGAMKCELDPSYPLTTRPRRAVNTRPIETGKAFLGRWFRPATLQEAGELKARFPGAQLTVGNTSMGVYPEEKPEHWIDVSWIPELTEKKTTEQGLRIGASVTIQDLIDFAATFTQDPGLKELVRHATLIAGRQVRSAGSVAGNVAITRRHADSGEVFPSDLYTVLLTLGTRVRTNTREMPLEELPNPDHFEPHELIVGFDIPFCQAEEIVSTHRVARRPQNSHALVAAGFKKCSDGGFRAVFAGLGRMVVRFERLEAHLAEKPLNDETLPAALKLLDEEMDAILVSAEHEGTGTEYRKRLARHFFYKFCLLLAGDRARPEHRSAAQAYLRPLSRARQTVHEHPELFPLSKPIIKRAAFVQATGETKYTQDLSLPTGGYHAALVKSTRAHARFHFKPDTEAELRKVPGFKALITAGDVPGILEIGLGEDDPVFARDVVTAVHARLGLCVAQTPEAARAAAALAQARVVYEDLPPVLTLDEAIQHNTSMPVIRKAKDPDEDVQQRLPAVTRPGGRQDWVENPDSAWPGTQSVSGTLLTNAQAHFYLETNVALAVPGDHDQITIYSSTQNPNGDQRNVARALGIKANQVTIVVGQLGGGFGGKQHQAANVSAAAAVAARKLNRPVRLCYDRATDTQCVGKRHPYLGHYHAAYTDEGHIRAVKLDLHSEAGNTYDCSFAVMDLSLLMSDCTYNVETFCAQGTVYRTNKTSNTAFRTFGTVQPYLVYEDAVEQIAWKLNKRPEDIRRLNLYTKRDATPYGQQLAFSTLEEIWDQLWRTCEFEKREQAVKEFNQSNRWRKRGLSMHGVKYGIGFTEPRGALNASSALVNVNVADGSVTIIHGGVEMGQGLHTKIAQMAAQVLGLPLEMIRVGGNNSDVIVNAPATAASTGYDLNAGAVEKACGAVRKRLERFCEDLEQFVPHDCIEGWREDWAGHWDEVVRRAWLHRVSLSAAELYKSPHYEGPSESHPQGHPFLYYAYAAAATEVEIDVLTGETVVLRSDLLYDVGKSPNPAVDIGQIEGGYVQGLGMIMTEEVLFDHDGRLITDNTWSYKPPCSKSIPLDFRVDLLHPEERLEAVTARSEYGAVKNSRTSGEPCLVLAVSAYLAIKRAVLAARTSTENWPRLDLPASVERVQTLCEVRPEHLTL